MARKHRRTALLLAGLLPMSMLLVGCATSTSGVSEGERALAAGTPRRAVLEAERALASGKLSPEESVAAHIVVAEGQLALGNFRQATSSFRAAATPAADPIQRARIARGLGDVRYRQRDLEGARVQYELTLDQALSDLERREVHYRLAVCYRAACREVEALAHAAQSRPYQPARDDPLRLESVSCVVGARSAHSGGGHSHSPVTSGRRAVQAPEPWDSGHTAMPSTSARTLVASGRKPRVLSRSSWGAVSGGGNSAAMGAITRVTIHHSGGKPFTSTSQEDAARAIKGIQTYHKKDQGWADIGYHFVIDPGGRVWEGRPIAVQGAHAGSRRANQGNVGIVLLGNFDEQQPTLAQKESLVELVGWLRATNSIPASMITTHNAVRRQFTGAGTECPGKHLAGFVADIARGPAVVARAGNPSPGAASRYHVRKGDTFFSIARSLGVSPTALQRANPGVSPRDLRAGAYVQVPR